MNTLKYFLKFLLIHLITLSLSVTTSAQDKGSNLSARNTINVYAGIFDLNINYERNIIQRSRSYSNLRLGLGKASFFTAGEGKYFNAAFVHLSGQKNSHLEVDLGIKYMLTNSIVEAGFSDNLIPDIFLGYRYEKPAGGFVFRIGLNYPTILNLGIGYRF